MDAEASGAFERIFHARDGRDWLPHWLKVVDSASHAFSTFAPLGLLLTSWPFAIVPAQYGLSYVVGKFDARKARIGFLWHKRQARSNCGLSGVKHVRDGELVYLVGRVKARQTIPALLDERPVVYRQVGIAGSGVRAIFATLVHEAGVDFAVVGGDGEQVLVQSASATLVPPAALPVLKLNDGPAFNRLRALPLPPESRLRRSSTLFAAERVLQDGDLVELLGYKSRVVDVDAGDRLERETPLRASVRGGPRVPLLIVPVD
jgi:hypothetical protein